MQDPEQFTEQTRHLVRIGAAVAGTTIGVVRRVLADAKTAVDAGTLAPAAVDEVLLQSYLFAGFPRTLNALGVWRDLSGHRAPDNDALAGVAHAQEWAARGDVTCRTVYGRVYKTLRDNIRALHPAIDEWMIVDGYGKVLSRPALDLLTRELCIIAACVAAEQNPQLRSHLRGARNCGASHDTMTQTLNALTDVVSRDAMTTARDELARVKEL